MNSPATIATLVETRMKVLVEGNSNSAIKTENRPGKRKREEEDDKLEEKLAKMTAEVSKLKEEQQKIVECSICKMLPREGPVPCCPRGHFVCSPCLKKWRESQDKKDRCPTCRSPMGTGTSLLAITVIKNALHSCKNLHCTTKTPLEQIEQHEKENCEFRPVLCPGSKCGKTLRFNEMTEHETNCEFTTWPKQLDHKNWKEQQSSSFYHFCSTLNFQHGIEIGSWKTMKMKHNEDLFFCRHFVEKCIMFVDVIMKGSPKDCKKMWTTCSVNDPKSGKPIYESSFHPRYIQLLTCFRLKNPFSGH